MSIVRIAFLHLAPCLRDLQANRRLIDRAVTTAATAGATWILTPELCICGYDFTDDLGTRGLCPRQIRGWPRCVSVLPGWG